MRDTDDGATPGTGSEDPFKDIRAAKPWLDAIRQYQKTFEGYNGACDKVTDLYASLKKMRGSAQKDREFQIFWANLEVLKPAIYTKVPVPVVSSRFKDRKPLQRHASILLERSLVTSFDDEDINATLTAVRDDLALYARGVMWLRYEADSNGDNEAVVYDHIDRKDFAHETARKWKEVGWVARRIWLTKDKGVKRFGDVFKQASFKSNKGDERKEEPDQEQRAAVWEIWSRDKGAVIWVTPNLESVLDIKAPFLNLKGFFPCPRPAYATLEPSTLLPVPDFVYYKDQVEEINELTARISALAEALRMKGFYSAGVEELSDAIEAALKKTDQNAILIPVPNTAALGGVSIKDSIVWLPVTEVAAVIVQLIELRKQLIDDVYQITGLSDIMRGATNPTETLGAQQLKSQYGSVRVKAKQDELVRVARDTSRMSGEIMAENFEPQTLMMMSQYDELPTGQAIAEQIQQVEQRISAVVGNPRLREVADQDPEVMKQGEQAMQQARQEIAKLKQTVTFEMVMELLRNERMRPFMLDIETDSTIQPDEVAAKAAMTEFMGALAQALGQLVPMVQGQPETAPFASEVLKMTLKPFRAGRELEATIDEFIDDMKRVAAQPRPNPEMEKMQAEIERQADELNVRLQEMTEKHDMEQDKAADQARLTTVQIAKTEAETTKIKRETELLGQEPQGKAA